LATFTDHVEATYLDAQGPAALLDVLSEAPGGNTAFGPAVSWALARISDASGVKAFSRADIVLVTDGQASSADAAELRKRAAELGVVIFGITIGAPGALRAWADHAADLDDVGKDTAATDLLFEGL
jgi:uncharacterized protein with von Willebrand factor type A (vWA) domain